MNEIFVKKYWEEEDVLFYMHFENGDAIRQIEITSNNRVYLDVQHPIQGESMLYDQKLDELDLNEENFITKEAFNKVWEEKTQT